MSLASATRSRSAIVIFALVIRSSLVRAVSSTSALARQISAGRHALQRTHQGIDITQDWGLTTFWASCGVRLMFVPNAKHGLDRGSFLGETPPRSSPKGDFRVVVFSVPAARATLWA